MATHKVIFLKCNGCGTSALPPGLIISDLLNMERPAPASVVEARHHAAAKGWWHTADGKDLCENCAPGPRPPGKAKLLAHIPHPHLPHWGAH